MSERLSRTRISREVDVCVINYLRFMIYIVHVAACYTIIVPNDTRRKLSGDKPDGGREKEKERAHARRGDKIVEGGDRQRGVRERERGSASGKRRKLMHSLCKIAEARG